MKAFGISVLFLVLLFISFAFTGEGTASSSSGLAQEKQRGYTKMTLKSRKLKGRGFTASAKNDKPETLNLEDYRPIDPVPSSKASIRPGPIQHGTPLMPYIPKPSPPPGGTKLGMFP